MADDIKTSIENWLVSVCVKRGVVGAVVALSAYVSTHAIGALLTKYGITINWTTVQASTLTAVAGGLAMLHDYLKVKKGITWL